VPSRSSLNTSKCLPTDYGPEHIRQYQARLFTDRKLGAISVAQQLSTLALLFPQGAQTPLDGRRHADAEAAYSFTRRPLPRRNGGLIQCTGSPLHRIWLLMLYATGLRGEELVRLKVGGIDGDPC